ncbi:MAG: hypothetical protein DDG60_15640 [Anaerolineae bacterium]|nr:MAG: hypothetical protein DDG60_15640 [Anaerolineae bacterium]
MSIYELFDTFANNILPILLISAAGFLVGKTFEVDSRAIGRSLFYFFTPILVFNLLLSNQLPATEVFRIGGIAFGVILSSGVMALLGGLVLRLERTALISSLLTAMFANNGNYGLPLIAFAFGQDALAHSGLYFVFASLLTNTLGVLIASLGHLDLRQALLGLFRVPTIYAALLAVLIHEIGIALPLPLERTIGLAANATLPLMIFLLGLELRHVRWTNSRRALGLSTTVRLLIGPLLGFAFVALFGLTGSARQAAVMEASMPCAVANANLAAEYRLDTSLVAATVLVSTLLSPLTLTPLILFLGR